MSALQNWSAHQLAELLGQLSAVQDEPEAVRVAIEHIAEAFDAEVCAVCRGDDVIDVIGFPHDRAPSQLIVAVAGRRTSTLDVPGVGTCHTMSATMQDDSRIAVARSREEFSAEEVGLLRAMARLVSLTVDNLRRIVAERRLREQSQAQALENARLAESLRERTVLMERLLKIERSISHRASLQDVLDAIVAGAHDLLGDEAVILRLVDTADPTHLVTVAAAGLSEDLLRAVWKIPVGGGAGGSAFAEDQLVVIDSYQSDPDALEQLAAGAMQTAMAAPVRHHGTPVGSLIVGSYRTSRTYSDSERAALLAFAEHASIAIADARTAAIVRESERRYRTIVETAHEGVWIVDADGTTTFVNARMAQMLGTEPHPMVGRPASDFGYKGARPTRESSRSSETLLRRADGSTFWALVLTSVVAAEDASPAYDISMVSDISNIKRAQEVLEDAFAREREAADRLRALDEMKNAILSAVSHELRTPLTVVLTGARTLEMLAPSLSEERAARLLSRLRANAERLESLLADLLDLDRLTRGILEPRRSVTNVRDLIDRVVASITVSEERKIDVYCPSLEAELDTAKVERIVENLVVNADKYSPRHEPIKVEAGPFLDGVVIAVEDRGGGVPPGLRTDIFQPFRQGPMASRHAPGVGIGLSLVARFAELHGGRAWVEDRRGGGSRFCVELPGRSAEEAEATAGAT